MNDLKFTVDIDKISESEWNDLILQFEDATTFQTWAYGKLNSKNLSHLVLKNNDEIVACAQVRIFKPPVLKIGIAYINPGPLWIKKGNEVNTKIIEEMATALKNEYSIKRGLYLKINLEYEKIDPYSEDIIKKFRSCGYGQQETGKHHAIVQLNKSMDEYRKDLDSIWRRNLKGAEKNSIEIIEGYEDEMITEFAEIFKSMVKRKKFTDPDSIDSFVELFKKLPQKIRPLVILCKCNNEFAGGGIFSLLGTRAIYLYGATNDLGRDCKVSYVMHWRIIDWLNNNGYSRYDLAGINKQNLGTYKFKNGLISKNGFIAQFLDPFVYSHSSLNKLLVKAIQKFVKKDF